jgi:N-acetylglucosaminyl-diphospho-decaprenol L-rhamnosyltransferase
VADEPDLTVVVLSWNTRDLTLRALAAVGPACAPYRVRTICVDNASGDGTAAAVRTAMPSVEVIENPSNLGYARGNAAATPRLAGRHAVFLNSDTEAPPGSLAHVVAYLDKHPRVGIASPRLVGEDGRPQRAAWGIPTPWALLHQYTPLGWLGIGREATRRQRAVEERHGPVEAVSGACLAARREAFDALGGFDAGYAFYGEDVDLCWRAARAGWEVHLVADGPPVVHRGGASVAQAEGATRLPLLAGMLRLQRKRLSRARYRLFATAFKVGVPPRALVEVLVAPFLALARRLSGRPERAARTWRLARHRLRFLTRDLFAFLAS